jgi:hypothetical protein
LLGHGDEHGTQSLSLLEDIEVFAMHVLSKINDASFSVRDCIATNNREDSLFLQDSMRLVSAEAGQELICLAVNRLANLTQSDWLDQTLTFNILSQINNVNRGKLPAAIEAIVSQD